MPIVCGARTMQWQYVRDAQLLHVPVFGYIGQAAEAELFRTTGERLDSHDPLQHLAKIAQLKISSHSEWLSRINPERLSLYAPAVM
jgi:hypothetical protein